MHIPEKLRALFFPFRIVVSGQYFYLHISILVFLHQT